jgi:hypothetical protein
MKSKILLAACTLLSTLNSQLSANAQGTAFTYQGRLNDGANLANGSYDLTLTIFGASSGGSAVAGPLTNSATLVSNGLFTVLADFGFGIFNGNPRWLEIGVRSAGSGPFTTLSPRQPITAAPYAIFAGNAGTGGGSPWLLNGTNTFYNNGNVGIGTASFGSLLTVGSSSSRGTFNVVGSSGAIPVMSLTDSRPGGRQYSIYGGLSGVGSLDIFDQTASANRFTITTNGAMKLGPGGQFFVPGGDENLRIVRGKIMSNGTVDKGAGFSVSHSGTGIYHITFNTPFASAPSFTATTAANAGAGWCSAFCSSDDAEVDVVASDGSPSDYGFDFIVIGPR